MGQVQCRGANHPGFLREKFSPFGRFCPPDVVKTISHL